MKHTRHQISSSSGFALLVVLSTLAILTLLFAISTARSLSHLQYQQIEVGLAEQNFRDHEALKAVVERADIDEVRRGGSISINLSGENSNLQLIDVGGLIDLNSASPPLLESLFAALDLDPDALASFRRWRQQSRRLLRVEDLERIVGENIDLALLQGVATVFSGRAGVAADQAASSVQNLFGDSTDLSQFASPPSNSSFLIHEGDRPLGVVFFAPSGVERVLWLN